MTTDNEKKFILLDESVPLIHRGEEGALGKIGLGNVFLTAYPCWPDGKSLDTLKGLDVGQEIAGVTYNLSGSKGSYTIRRVQLQEPAMGTSNKKIMKDCPVHGLTEAVESVKKPGPDVWCLKCIARNAGRSPRSFVLTWEFRVQLDAIRRKAEDERIQKELER